MNEPDPAVTRIIQAAGSGDREAAEQLIPLVYDELRRLAQWRLGKESSPNTLQATALVHEAYLRRRNAVKHGGEMDRVTWIEDGIAAPLDDADELLAVHEILDRFAALEPRKAELVKLRYFIGMTIEDAADTLGISAPTAKRDWTYARAWLFRELQAESRDRS